MNPRPRTRRARMLALALALVGCDLTAAPRLFAAGGQNYSTIQAAIDAAALSGGGLVRLPCGVFQLDAPLVVDAPGVTLRGCGPQGTVLAASAALGDADIIQLGNAANPFSPCGGVEDLSIRSAPRTGGYAIVVSGCEHGNLENLRIHTDGGGGIRFTGTSSAVASIFFARALDIEIQGPHTALLIEGSNDRYVSDVWLRGDRSPGSRGIVVRESGGDWLTNVEAVVFEVGVEIAPGPGQLVQWSHFANVLADSNTRYGFHFAGSGTIFGVSCARCWASSNGTDATGRGMLLENGAGLSFVDSRVLNNGGHGLEAGAGVSDLGIHGGVFAQNCLAPDCTPGTGHGIVTAAQGARVIGVASRAVFGPSKQGLGVLVLGPDTILLGADTRGGGVGGAPAVAAGNL